ncbi:TPA: helix-turn-helix domain-containing protein [Enterococcus faecalis]
MGCLRFVYNHVLHLWTYKYLTTGKVLSYNSCSDMFPQ